MPGQVLYKKTSPLAMGERAMIRRARRKGRLDAIQAATARGALAEVKTPMGAGQAVLGAGPVTGSATVNVQNTIPAGSVLWISGLPAGSDTLDSVLVDGVNVFTNGAVASDLVDPSVFNGVGVLITRPISQTITWTVSSAAGNAIVTGTLVAPSREVEDVLDAADAACSCG
jgi:hypothetical protein